MPIFLRVLGYKFYFWSNENGEPIHFHMCKGSQGYNNTKFWILQDGTVVLCHNKSKYPKNDIAKILRALNDNKPFVFEIMKLWQVKFGYIKFVQ